MNNKKSECNSAYVEDIGLNDDTTIKINNIEQQIDSQEFVHKEGI